MNLKIAQEGHWFLQIFVLTDGNVYCTALARNKAFTQTPRGKAQSQYLVVTAVKQDGVGDLRLQTVEDDALVFLGQS